MEYCKESRLFDCFNLFFLAYKLATEPDWDFMRENQSKLAFLFGIDDHWGPLQLFEEVN